MGNPPWTKEPRFSDTLSRYENHDDLDRLIGDWTREHKRYEVMQIMQQAGVASAPVLNFAEVLDDNQIQERGFFEVVTRPVTGTHPHPGFPVKFSETSVTIRRPAPTLGQDNEDVLTRLLGMTEEEIRQLAEEEIIGTKPHGWAYAMEADEAISRLRDIHTKGGDSRTDT